MMLPSEEGKELVGLLESRQYAKAHAWLNRLCPAQLEGEDARLCLAAALRATPNLFRKVLRHCPPGEYSAQVRLEIKAGVNAYVYGTLLTLAAAMNRPDHVRILLELGYDPNSAGPASATAFMPDVVWFAGGKPGPYGDRMAVSGSRVCFCGRAGWMIQNATPLAAAVACGSREAAAVLLRSPEVWTAESGVVCRAAVSALQMFPDDPRQQLAGMVFGRTRGQVFYPKDLIRTCDLQIEYAADFCAYELLETQIKQGFCDEAGARQALGLLEEHALFSRYLVRARMRKMNLLVQQFPVLRRDSWVAGLFLRELVRRYTPESPHVRLMHQWKRLCGQEGDLTWARTELYRMPRPHLQSLLKALRADIRLVMDADAFGCFGGEAKGELIDLLSCVELRHNRGLEGVSALTATLLRMSGDRRYLRKAARLGAFAGEDPKALLEYLASIARNDLRALVLAFGGQGDDAAQPPRWKSEWREELWSRQWEMDNTAYAAWLQELIDQELPEEACLSRLQMMNYAVTAMDFWGKGCVIPVELTGHPGRKTLQVAQPEAAISCGTQTQPLKLMMKHMPEKLDHRYRVDFCHRQLLNLEGTPLCIAAATGRTELVQLLLDAGFDPDERGRGVISALQWFTSDALAVTPLMAAVYYGEAETARQLLEAGAVCDFSQPLFRRLLERGDEKTLELASGLPGFDSISPEWLESLKEKKIF